jgi:hypothetical protein
VSAAEIKLSAAVERIVRTWSLIKLIPRNRSAGIRASICSLLSEQKHLSENELVVLGLKHLYRTDQQASRGKEQPDAAAGKADVVELDAENSKVEPVRIDPRDVGTKLHSCSSMLHHKHEADSIFRLEATK